MEPIRNIIFNSFEIRKNNVQKDAFIAWVLAFCEEKGIPCRVESNHGLLHSRNILLNHLENADVLLTAHYDTCARMPFPNLIFPCHFIFSILVQMLFLLPLFAVLAIVSLAALWWTQSFFLFALLLYGGLFSLLWLLIAGPANPHTANDNTSGVIAVLRMMETLKNNSHAAAVLFDHEELGMLGSAQFSKQHKASVENLLVLNFDCISDGDHLLFAARKKAVFHPRYTAFCAAAEKMAALHKKQAVFFTTRQAVYPSDQLQFPCGVGIAACHKIKGLGYYLSRIHTPKDTVFDEKNLTVLCEATVHFLQEEP